MDKLQSYTEAMLRGQIPRQPVKIAILDTGAHILPAQLRIYDDRIKKCRSWLQTSSSSGRSIGPTSDRDGHGTHGVGALLDATQGTGIEVYVAQIFDKRREKVVRDPIVDDPTIMRISQVSRLNLVRSPIVI
jgi:hypothetical protein